MSTNKTSYENWVDLGCFNTIINLFSSMDQLVELLRSRPNRPIIDRASDFLINMIIKKYDKEINRTSCLEVIKELGIGDCLFDLYKCMNVIYNKLTTNYEIFNNVSYGLNIDNKYKYNIITGYVNEAKYIITYFNHVCSCKVYDVCICINNNNHIYYDQRNLASTKFNDIGINCVRKYNTNNTDYHMYIYSDNHSYEFINGNIVNIDGKQCESYYGLNIKYGNNFIVQYVHNFIIAYNQNICTYNIYKVIGFGYQHRSNTCISYSISLVEHPDVEINNNKLHYLHYEPNMSEQEHWKYIKNKYNTSYYFKNYLHDDKIRRMEICIKDYKDKLIYHNKELRNEHEKMKYNKRLNYINNKLRDIQVLYKVRPKYVSPWYANTCPFNASINLLASIEYIHKSCLSTIKYNYSGDEYMDFNRIGQLVNIGCLIRRRADTKTQLYKDRVKDILQQTLTMWENHGMSYDETNQLNMEMQRHTKGENETSEEYEARIRNIAATTIASYKYINDSESILKCINFYVNTYDTYEDFNNEFHMYCAGYYKMDGRSVKLDSVLDKIITNGNNYVQPQVQIIIDKINGWLSTCNKIPLTNDNYKQLAELITARIETDLTKFVKWQSMKMIAYPFHDDNYNEYVRSLLINATYVINYRTEIYGNFDILCTIWLPALLGYNIVNPTFYNRDSYIQELVTNSFYTYGEKLYDIRFNSYVDMKYCITTNTHLDKSSYVVAGFICSYTSNICTKSLKDNSIYEIKYKLLDYDLEYKLKYHDGKLYEIIDSVYIVKNTGEHYNATKHNGVFYLDGYGHCYNNNFDLITDIVLTTYDETLAYVPEIGIYMCNYTNIYMRDGVLHVNKYNGRHFVCYYPVLNMLVNCMNGVNDHMKYVDIYELLSEYTISDILYIRIDN